MTVDPKFANLPWIAHDEPDVYESGDLPESEQRGSNTATDDQVLPKEIEVTNISASDALKRFSKCKVDATNVDFSDGKFGYKVDCSEYQLLPREERETENLTQRFQRLQVEVQQFLTDTDTVKKGVNSADPATTGELSITQLTDLAAALSQQLNSLNLAEIFGPNADILLSGQEGVLQKRLLDQIANFKPQAKSSEGKTSEERITYDIYSKPTAQEEAKTEKMVELDRRLQRLESILGKEDTTRISALTADTMGNGLLEAANRLAVRSALLQPGHLDQIETRLAALQIKLASVTEKREAIADADSQQKIAELYELVKKWDSFSMDLPQIVDRLQDLQQLHEQASEFSSSLVNLEYEQKQMDQKLGNYKILLEQVQVSVQDALTTFRENVAVLESRLKSASK